MNHNTTEQHPNLPSGEWEGLYKYPAPLQGMFEEGKMSFVIDFCNGGIIGFGSDQVGGYTWKGSYNTDKMQCWIIKSYTTHSIEYEGNIDENGIWGFWLTGNDRFKGTFHIWPKGKEVEEVSEARKEEVMGVKKTMVKSL